MEFQVMFTILFVAAGILLLEIAVKRETFDCSPDLRPLAIRAHVVEV